MNLASVIDIFGAGTSEGAQKAWDTRGRGRHEQEKELSPRALRAKETHVPADHHKQMIARSNERVVAGVIKGDHTPDNHPFDILLPKSKIGVEVKTVFPGVKNEKITMHPEARQRKEDAMKALKLKKVFTVICDERSGRYFLGEGLKSFRFGPKALAGGKGVKEITIKSLAKFVR